MGQSYMSMFGNGEQKHASPTHTKKRAYNILMREEQIDVIKNTIYHMAFFPQGCKMAAVALAILSQSRQKEIGRETVVQKFFQKL